MVKNSKLLILFFTMVVVMMGFGLIIPIIPFYVEQYGAGGSVLGALIAVFSIMQFIFSPIWGDLSDRYGRKRLLMLGVFGNAISQLVFGFATNLGMMFLSRALAGMLSSATLPTALAYIGDSTTKEERGGGMGIIGAAMGVGMVIGPGIGGWLGGQSLSTPFFLAAGLSVVAMLLIWAILPELLPVERRSTPAKKAQRGGPAMRGGPLARVRLMWQALLGPIGFLFFLAFLVSFGLSNFEGIFGLFAQRRYDYGPAQVGTILMVVGIVSALVQGLLTGPATRRLGEGNVIKLSLVGSALGFALMVMAPRGPLVYVSVGFFVFTNAMLRPSIFSMTSKMAEGEMGLVMGLNNSFQSLGRVIGPLWGGFLIDVGVILPYLSAVVIMVISFALSAAKLPPDSSDEIETVSVTGQQHSPGD